MHIGAFYIIYVSDSVGAEIDDKVEPIFNEYCAEKGRLCALLNVHLFHNVSTKLTDLLTLRLSLDVRWNIFSLSLTPPGEKNISCPTSRV